MEGRQIINEQFPRLDFTDETAWTRETLLVELRARRIQVPSGQNRKKRKYIELLQEFQNQQPPFRNQPPPGPPEAPPQHLYIDPETVNDADPRFDNVEKIEAELRARDIPLPHRPDAQNDENVHQYWETCWAELTAWIHGDMNIKPNEVPVEGPGLSPDEIDLQQREQHEAVRALQAVELQRFAEARQVELDNINRQRQECATIASMPSMLGEEMVEPARGTFATPVIDQAFSTSFSTSFHAIKKVHQKFSNLRDLVPLRARDLLPNNVIAWAHTIGAENKLTSLLVIYRVLGVGVSYVSVTQLSEYPASVTGTPERNGQLTLNTPVYGLSLDSIESIRRIFQIPEFQATGMTLSFPSDTMAVNEHQKRLAWTGEVITLDHEGEEGFNCFGDEVRNTSTAVGGALALTSGARPALKQAGSSNPAKDLTAAISELAKTKTAVETKKTVGGYLRDGPAAVFSAEPSTLLKQGNLEVLQRMSYSHLACSSSSTEISRLVFWGLQGPFRTQLQAAHLITMLQSMMSVDIRMFADMHAALGPHLAQNLVDRCAASDALTLDASILPYLDVVGCQSERFEHLLRNFGFVVDNLLLLCPMIREAMRSMLSRFIQHAQRMILDPTDVVTALLYVYWAHEFQSAVNQAYTMVRSSALKSVDGVVEFWAKIPNTSDQFQPFLQGQLHIQHMKAFPHHITLTPPSAPTYVTTPFGGMSSQSPLQPQNLGLSGGVGGNGGGGGRGSGGRGNGGQGNGGRGGANKKEKICAFYITKSHDGKNDGCKRQPCTWAHQKYSEDVAKQSWVTEFLKRNKRTLDPAKKA